MKTKNASPLLAVLLLTSAAPALAGKTCDDIKSEIAARLDAKGVKAYTLTIIGKDDPANGSVVGYCAGGLMAIVYKRS
ncbi:MAG: hypothetical protein NVS9B10_05430 [Nevskia sp.]